MEKERKMYIDGLKGVACFFIMLGHYTGIYKYAQGGESRIFSWILLRVFRFQLLWQKVFGCIFFL